VHIAKRIGGLCLSAVLLCGALYQFNSAFASGTEQEQKGDKRSRRSRRNPTRAMPQTDYEFESGVFTKLRRLAIRAAKFEPEAD